MKKAPHVIPYQGSKRKLAGDILSYMDFDIETLYEPFVGSGAVTLAAAANQTAKKFVVGDKFEPLVDLWKLIINNPNKFSEEYSILWNDQLPNPAFFYKKVRDDFNKNKNPSDLFYLIARCVKNAVRFNMDGDFNQGPDNRRLGLKPEKLKREAILMSDLLRNRIDIISGDFRKTIALATPRDLVYMDPPWQGTSGKRDPRYAYLLDLNELIEELDSLNERSIPYILSFDGSCGDKSYGTKLPDYLQLKKVELHAGRSSQATLLGRDDVTVESLYLSPAVTSKTRALSLGRRPLQFDFLEAPLI